MSDLYIITGASRGLGRGIADQLAAEAGATVLGLSRHAPADAKFEQWPCDLADAAPVAARLAQWLAGFAPSHFASATLINNAALVTEPQPLADSEPAALSAAVRVGLEAHAHARRARVQLPSYDLGPFLADPARRDDIPGRPPGSEA